MHALVAAGADLIELGVPFSDPMADGPVIQHASERAIARASACASARWVASSANAMPAHTDRADGLSQSGRDPRLRALRREAVRGRRRWRAAGRLPAGGERAALDRCARPACARSCWPRRPPRPARMARCAGRRRVSCTMSRLPASPARRISTSGRARAGGDDSDPAPRRRWRWVSACAMRDRRPPSRAFADAVVIGSALVERLAGSADGADGLTRAHRGIPGADPRRAGRW